MAIYNEQARKRINAVVRQHESFFNSNVGDPSRERNGFCELPHTFYNDSGETIPKYALMAIDDAGADGQGCPVFKVKKPSATLYRRYAVNGPYAVASEEKGQCYVSGHVRVAYDTGTPVQGEGWGAKSGQFTASNNYPACLDVCGVWDETNKIMLAVLRQADDILRCKLTEALYDCGEAEAVVLRLDAATDSGSESAAEEYPCDEHDTITVTSPMGLVAACLLAVRDGEGELYIPAGMTAYVKRFSDTGNYEVLAFGSNPCCVESGSESESSASGSGESGSPSSEDSSGSGKDSAIVPASWSPDGYAALFTIEAPEVRFDDVMKVEVTEKETRVLIAPRYIEVCEPGSVEVCGCAADQPLAVGASVEGSDVVVRLPKRSAKPIRVVVRLTGIRKGFAGVRFADKTREEFEANERFLNMSRPKR